MSGGHEKIGLAILGAGIFAHEAHLPALAHASLKEIVELKAIYSRSKKSAADLAVAAKNLLGVTVDVYFDVEDNSDSSIPGGNILKGSIPALLERGDIQAVLVLLPIPIQPSIVLQSLRAGKHVLSEKPIAPSVADGRELINGYRTLLDQGDFKPTGNGTEKQPIWRVAENYEAEPGYQLLRSLLSTKSAGSPIGTPTTLSLSAHTYLPTSSKYYKTPWRTHPSYQGGFLLDGGVHSAAILRTILPSGCQPVEIASYVSTTRRYLDPGDSMVCVVKLGKWDEKESVLDEGENEDIYDPPHGAGPTATFTLTFSSPTPSFGPPRNGMDILGTKGWIEVRYISTSNGRAMKITVHSVVDKGDKEEEEVKEYEEVMDSSVRRELEAFFCLIKGRPGIKDEFEFGLPEETLRDVAFIEAAIKSNGEKIDLRQLVLQG